MQRAKIAPLQSRLDDRARLKDCYTHKKTLVECPVILLIFLDKKVSVFYNSAYKTLLK